MTALIIADLKPINKEHLTAYSSEAAKSLIPFNGKFLAKGSINELHGQSGFTTKVVIQFPDRESAYNWYHSDSYQAIIPLREKGMVSQFHLID